MRLESGKPGVEIGWFGEGLLGAGLLEAIVGWSPVISAPTMCNKGSPSHIVMRPC